MFYYNSLDDACKSVVGAVREGTKLVIKVYTDFSAVTMHIVADKSGMETPYPMRKSKGGFFVYVDLPTGLYWYYFSAASMRFGRGENLNAVAHSDASFQLTFYNKQYVAPSLLKGSVIYQIFPDRFCRSGDFNVALCQKKREDWGGEPTYRDIDGVVRNNELFGGNFKGIKSKLKYLKKLGVSVIYLNPIVKAYSSHRYDTGDYLKPDPALGTEKQLKSLISAAEKIGISMVFDGVYNHTGADSVYFNRYGRYKSVGAFNSKKSPYHCWFDFIRFPDKYSSWWGFESLPSIKKDSVYFQDFICKKVLPKYFGMGFKGVRLDVVDELKESFVKRIKQTATEYSENNVVIGEVWEDATNKTAYGERRHYFQGEELDSVMNYPLREGIIGYLLTSNTKWLVNVMREQVNNFSEDALASLMNVLSTHDTPRIITVLGRSRVVLDKDLLKFEHLSKTEYERGKTLAKMAYTVAFTCYGAPSVYYGDEAGLTGDLDPYNRRCYPWGKEDKDMLEFMCNLSSIRKSSNALKKGKFKIVYVDTQVLVYSRTYGREKVLVALSKNAFPVTLKLNEHYRRFGEKEEKTQFVLQPDSAIILKRK